MPGKFYITTPIYYTNDKPHLGHVFEVIGIDVQARFRRLLGHQVYFLTGTDEHGQKIQNQAAARGISPQELVDQLAAQFQSLWAKLHISADDFIRTTQPRHIAACQQLWREVEKRGFIYKANYEGWYNTRDENYMSADELKAEGLSTDDPHIKWMQEECYFFKLSHFQSEIEELFKRPGHCLPEFRAREMAGSFLKQGLRDLSISRSTIHWGIPVPDAPGHVMYVWFDALTNYLSAIGYGRDDSWKQWWPADVHVVGKDILKFHTILWPAMLMAADIEPAKKVFGHGFITLGDEKMSKSRGNVIDPVALLEDYSIETLRYYLLRDVPYGGDGAFVEENLRTRYNADLANGIGNLLSRTLTLTEKNLDGEIHEPAGDNANGEGVAAVRGKFEEVFSFYENAMESFEYAQALAKVWEGVATLDRYINETKPWALAKDAARKDELTTVLYVASEGLRMLASLIQPFMPETAKEIWRRLGLSKTHLEITWEDHKRWGLLKNGMRIDKGAPLFPRLEEKEIVN